MASIGHLEVAHVDYYLPDGRLLSDASFRVHRRDRLPQRRRRTRRPGGKLMRPARPALVVTGGIRHLVRQLAGLADGTRIEGIPSGVGEAGSDHDAQRVARQRNPDRGAAMDLPVDVQGQRRVSVQPEFAGRQERRLGVAAPGTGERVADGRGDQ
jgi:hypothetical protein